MVGTVGQVRYILHELPDHPETFCVRKKIGPFYFGISVFEKIFHKENDNRKKIQLHDECLACAFIQSCSKERARFPISESISDFCLLTFEQDCTKF